LALPRVRNGQVGALALKQAVTAGHTLLIGIEIRQVEGLFHASDHLAPQDKGGFRRHQHALAGGEKLQDSACVQLKQIAYLIREQSCGPDSVHCILDRGCGRFQRFTALRATAVVRWASIPTARTLHWSLLHKLSSLSGLPSDFERDCSVS
jgi:hypothetical protein